MKMERINKKYLADWFAVAPGVWGIRDIFVNVYLIHNPANNNWVLLDAGLKSSAPKIHKVVENLFWPELAPSSIILTHAHFDHIGSLKTLVKEWNVPVYAHRMEYPYLTGASSYPPPDPSVGGGLMSLLSFTFPNDPIDISEELYGLPIDGSVPGLPKWQYIHTPGHSPGHISLYRKSDGVLLAGDAFVTTKQESAISVMRQTKIISGPPKYFTYDWDAAQKSVKTLADLNPEIVATGHGKPMQGEAMGSALKSLSENFRNQAVPSSGRYVGHSALVDEDGVKYLPPPTLKKLLLSVGAITLVLAVGCVLLYSSTLRKKRRFSFLF